MNTNQIIYRTQDVNKLALAREALRDLFLQPHKIDTFEYKFHNIIAVHELRITVFPHIAEAQEEIRKIADSFVFDEINEMTELAQENGEYS